MGVLSGLESESVSAAKTAESASEFEPIFRGALEPRPMGWKLSNNSSITCLRTRDSALSWCSICHPTSKA